MTFFGEEIEKVMEKGIYLDNAATTKPCEEAVRAMIDSAENFGNPSSLHGIGLDAEKMVEKSRKIIADKLGVDSKNIYFTSGGTESNNTAIYGAAYGLGKLGKELITTQVEHPSVLESFKRLENEGYKVTYLGVDADGLISLDELRETLSPKTVLVSIMHVNNETGVIFPVDKIKEIMTEKAPRALLHCDCVQSFCKVDVKPKLWDADLVSISAHKIHGFKGTGALYIKKPQAIKTLITGGEQQGEIRPGTENTGGIAAFGAAAEVADINPDRMRKFRLELKEKIQSAISDTVINGTDGANSGSVLNVSFLGVKAEILLHALETHNIYVSTGSACSSHKPQPSHVLSAMGCDKKRVEGAIRISFTKPLGEDEQQTLVDALKKEVEMIRKYM